MTYYLSAGTHRPNPRRYCAMELLSAATGQRWTDHPAGVDPLLACVVRTLNDAVPSRSIRTELLLPYVLRDVDDHRGGAGALHGTDDGRHRDRARVLHELFGDRWATWLTYHGAAVTLSKYQLASVRKLLDRLIDPSRPLPRIPVQRQVGTLAPRTGTALQGLGPDVVRAQTLQ